MSLGLYSVSGLASGLDWAKIIQDVMSVARRPAQLLEERKAGLERVKAAWGEIEGLLERLDGQARALTEESAWQVRLAKSSAEGVVSAAAGTTAPTGSYAVEVVRLAQAHVVASDAQADPAASLNLTGTFTVGVGDRQATVEVAPTDSLLVIRDRINAAAGAMVVASVVDGRLVVRSLTTGKAGAMAWRDTSGTVLQSLGVLTPPDASGNVSFKNQLAEPLDAELRVDGLTVSRSSNTVTDVVPGLTLHLHGTGSATVTVALDVDRLVGQVRGFVNAYNAALERIRALGSKGATLFGDFSLQQIERQLRHLAYETVRGLDPATDSLYDIGISSVDRSGTLAIDESKLRTALDNRAADVAALFSSPAGVATRLHEAVGRWLDEQWGSVSTRQRGVDAQITRITEQLQALEDRLERERARLAEQFVQLEKALAAWQSQGALVQQRLAMLERQTRW